jgi:hypothetical protein
MLTDLEARKIADAWHGGQASPLYALTSTGALVKGVHAEISDCALLTDDPDGWDELGMLLTYVKAHYPRGPVDGWSDLRW